MANEKESVKFTRRQFLKGGLALGATALLSSACQLETKPSSPQKEPSPQPKTKPSLTPSPLSTPEQAPSPSPEATLAEEGVRIPGLVITQEYLQEAFAGIGGGETIDNGEEEVSFIQFGQDYVSQSWGEEIDFSSLSENSIASLKYLVSLGAYRGEEGVFSPGKQEEKEIFPQLADLSLARLTLKNVPSETEQKREEFKEWVSPQNFLLRPETQLTVVGLLETIPEVAGEEAPEQEPAAEGLDYALVALTDYLRAEEKTGVPRHYLAILPTHFPAEPENKEALTLANLLEANGYQYDWQKKEIVLVDQENHSPRTVLELNRIEGEELGEQIKQEVGLAFVDQMKGELIKNPVVPYPDEMPSVWDLEEVEDEAGNVTLLLKSQDQEGKLQDFARASYDQEKGEWGWERVSSSEERLAKAPTVEGLGVSWEEDRIVYRAEAGNPYNLKEGEYAGYFYPETYVLEKETNFEEERQVGAVGLRSEVVRSMLTQAGYPNQIVFPIPFDLSYVAEGERIILTEAVGRNTGKTRLIVHLPRGSRLVAGLPDNQGRTNVHIAPQTDNRVAIDFKEGFSGNYAGYRLAQILPNSGLEGGDITLNFGDSLSGYSLDNEFSSGYLGFLSGNFEIPNKLKQAGQKLNLLIHSQTYVEPMLYADITKENLLKTGESPVFILANDNSLLK
jgi:hypothetical protein